MIFDLLGVEVKIIESSNKSQLKMAGFVYQETKNTLVIKVFKKFKRIAKKGLVLNDLSDSSRKIYCSYFADVYRRTHLYKL